jgi:hypothetical protein
MKVLKDFKLTLKYNKKLNPKIWKDDNLKTEIRVQLLKIAYEWMSYANIPSKIIDDIIIVGGNTNYNYTRYSDIDLHIKFDFDNMPECDSLIKDYFKEKKINWGLTHKIKIYGIPVEIYAQDSKEKFSVDSGIFSVKKNEWINKPQRTSINLYDDKLLIKKVKDYQELIDYLISNFADAEELKNVKQKLRNMRTTSVQEKGEYSFDNLVFKELRNKGYLKKIDAYINSQQDKKLSLTK